MRGIFALLGLFPGGENQKQQEGAAVIADVHDGIVSVADGADGFQADARAVFPLPGEELSILFLNHTVKGVGNQQGLDAGTGGGGDGDVGIRFRCDGGGEGVVQGVAQENAQTRVQHGQGFHDTGEVKFDALLLCQGGVTVENAVQSRVSGVGDAGIPVEEDLQLVPVCLQTGFVIGVNEFPDGAM